MNWKEKAQEIIYSNLRITRYDKGTEEALIETLFKFAKLACEEQKILCAESFKKGKNNIYEEALESELEYIKDTPTVKFD